MASVPLKLATHHERETFVADLIRQAPKATIHTVTRLLRLGATYRRLYGVADPRKSMRIRHKMQLICIAADCHLTLEPLAEHILWVKFEQGIRIPIPTS